MICNEMRKSMKIEIISNIIYTFFNQLLAIFTEL